MFFTEAERLSVVLGKLQAHGCLLDCIITAADAAFMKTRASKSLTEKAKGHLAKNWAWKSNLNGESEHLVANLNDT